MRNIIFSCFNKSDPIYADYLTLYIEEAKNYETNFKVQNILKDQEKKYFEYLLNSFESSGAFPGKDLFEMVFPETKGGFSKTVEIPITDLRVYIFTVIDARLNDYVHDSISKLNQRVKDEGINQEISDEFSRLETLSNRNKVKEVELDIDSKKEYELKKLRPTGLQTGIKEIDDRIGGMSEGTVTTIAGFVANFKTTFAVNIAHINAYYLGYNIVYISLETPKQDMNWNLLSCHSFIQDAPGFGKFNFVGHDKMRHCLMTADEEDFIFNVVEPDLKNDYIGDDGKTHKRGKIIILDESDFNTFSFSEITSVLEKVDDELDGHLDAVIVDYIQLCKFSGSGYTADTNSQINAYVTFFRRLSQNFRKVVDANGKEDTKQLVMILLAQLIRGGWQKASRNNGKYDLTALADANEVERGSYRIFTTYTTEEMKGRKSAQVQILKNRSGQTMYEPAVVYADGEAYVFADEDSQAGNTFGSGTFDGTASIDSAFSNIDFDDFGSLGGLI